MYADNIVKMLKDIRRTVRASAKLQPGSNAFAQFLDEVHRQASSQFILSVAIRFDLGLVLTFCGESTVSRALVCPTVAGGV